MAEVTSLENVFEVFTRGRMLMKCIAAVVLIAVVVSSYFSISWALFAVPFSFASGCFIAFIILRKAEVISSVISDKLMKSFAYDARHRHTSHFLCGISNDKSTSGQAIKCMASPLVDLKIPHEIDKAVEEILNLILKKHIYSWYKNLGTDDSFVQEIRVSLRFLFYHIFERALKVDLVSLISVKTANISLQQLQYFIEGKKYSTSASDIESSILQYIGSNLHTAMTSRKMEVAYLRKITEHIIPFLVPKSHLMCRSTSCLLQEISCNLVLLPLMDIIADPDIINQLLILFFDETPMIKYPESPYPSVEFLSNFVTKQDKNEKPAMLHTDLKSILGDQSLLYCFMSFLKEENAINFLQFLLAVDDFNTLSFNPDLSLLALKSLQQSAQEIFDTYFAPNSVDHINFDATIISEMNNIISGPVESIEKLRTTPPLFKAYEYAYAIVDQVYCPLFLQSDKYFRLICGDKFCASSSRSLGKPAKKNNSGISSVNKLGNKLKDVFSPNIDDGQVFEDESGTDLAESLFSELEFVVDSYNIDDTYRMDNDPRLKKLSAWRVFIPRISTGMDQNCKYYHAFHIEIQRIDVQDHENPDDIHWELERRYSEFYVLEAKLKEFHGELPIHLPPKHSQLQKKAQFLESQRFEFEKFLQTLLTLPSLQGSELLYKFLRTPIPFTSTLLPNIKLGKMIKTVPWKLIKEKGQNLLPFLQALIASSEGSKPKPSKWDWNQAQEFSASPNEGKLRVGIFGDNYASVKKNIKQTQLKYPVGSVIDCAEMYDYLHYLITEVLLCGYKFQEYILQLMIGCDALLRKPIQTIIELFLSCKLQMAFKPQRIAEVINLLHDVLALDNDLPRTKKEKLECASQALQQMKDFFPKPFHSKEFDDGLTVIFEALQYPLLNKQLSYVLLDMLIIELFPEIQINID